MGMTCMLSADMLRTTLISLGASRASADRYAVPLSNAMLNANIDTALRASHFLAQVAHESAGFRAVAENLNYSAAGLLKTFPKYFRAYDKASTYARKPEQIANYVYASRMGNGPESSGDGYKYRGRGLIQLTGKNNYKAFSDWVGFDCVVEPDRVAGEFAAHSAVFYWDTNRLNGWADADDIVAVTRHINGGTNGLADRKELLAKAKAALASDMPLLQMGSSGEDVRRLQALLNERGAALLEDGNFGQITTNAVKYIQTDLGLPADGIVGRRTWVALYGV